ncbi:hypothetical protein GCM10009541_40060 [Micromonospora gifhornensis]|uniref:Uncharacterized protein n=1 Tax=Micromonospora gifhornensis TaxID=84594 RepID=A0ABQ4IDY3_9ACTN|nr:hypothetical protein Vgi01_28060 [Micromonospora gifhornensis]
MMVFRLSIGGARGQRWGSRVPRERGEMVRSGSGRLRHRPGAVRDVREMCNAGWGAAIPARSRGRRRGGVAVTPCTTPGLGASFRRHGDPTHAHPGTNRSAVTIVGLTPSQGGVSGRRGKSRWGVFGHRERESRAGR